MSLVHALKTEAVRLGFERVGITTPEPPRHFSVYERWINAGLHGEMSYLATERARHRRANPRLILSECQSILVLAARVPIEASLSVPQNPSMEVGRAVGRIAAYACGKDYHDLFPPRLQALIAFLESQVGHPIPNRYYTDTGPLLERDLAQRAGLGWIGKNTCLIVPGLGSFFLLAEILLGIHLDPDPPFFADRCGSCTRCIRACPMGCILPNRTIDAQRCISYLTIEAKGAIPPGFRSQIGEWVFGCDICQQVCPWNRAVPTTPYGSLVDLQSELILTNETFKEHYRGKPVMRARRSGYLRNVAVALGNTQNILAIPALAQCLSSDPDPLVRGHAAWALGHIGGLVARQSLLDLLDTEPDPAVILEIQTALNKTGVL